MKTKSSSLTDIGLTAIAPAIWGTTYLVTTEFLPHGYPLTVAMLRALPAGIVLLLIVRQLPQGIWWARSFILGALNFSFFWTMLFISAYRLPGGVAATVGAIQPLIVVMLARMLIGTSVKPMAIVAGVVGMAGVGLLVLTPGAALDPIGIMAGLAGAVSMALGTVMTRHWTPPVSSLTFTAWQLTAGGLMLLPLALLFEPALPIPTTANVLGMVWLGLIGAALTYMLWFRGLSKLESAAVASLGFLSPLVATLLGWGVLGQNLTPLQLVGMVAVLVSVWLGQMAQRRVSPVAPQAVRPQTPSSATPLRHTCTPLTPTALKPTRPCA